VASSWHRLRPRRFRRRLTVAFLLTAAVSSGVLAVATYVVASGYRWRNFRQAAQSEAQLFLALAPQRLDAATFDHLLDASTPRVGIDLVAEGSSGAFTSSATLSIDDVPSSLRSGAESLATADVRLGGDDGVVVGGAGPGGSRYYLFFSTSDVQASLAELRSVVLIVWLLIVAAAAAVGNQVARRTLRPVREAAAASAALAEGLLHTHVPPSDDDDLGLWAASFTQTAAALEEHITRVEAAAERERRFSADIAHELRTPLTGLVATASLLEEDAGQLPPDVRRSVVVLVRDIRRMRDLVLELLELARNDDDWIEPEPLRLRDAVEAVTATALAAHPDATIIIEIADDLEICADRARLRRILSNVITNAITHGGGTVHVTAREDGKDVSIAVCDDGPGIPTDALAHVFDRFYKSDTSRASGGTGLGLSIARQHADAMDGALTAENRAGGGACLTLRLPLADAPSPAASVTIA
jgi:two-component system sensor histidine kinase MtrB